MILYVENEKSIFDFLDSYILTDSFACRIYSMCKSYKPSLQFVDYWLVKDDETQNFTGAILRCGYDFTLFLTSQTDLTEVSDFVKMTGAISVLCDGKYNLKLENYIATCGSILYRNSFLENKTEGNFNFSFTEPNIKSAYEILKSAESQSFMPPKFEDFYIDVNHKLRHKIIRLNGVAQIENFEKENSENKNSENKNSEKENFEKENLVGIAMTIAETEKSAIIGAVATSPKFRKKGIGFFAVNTMVNQLVCENKNVFVYRAKDENIHFYDTLNFKQIGLWNEYKLKD